MTPDVTLDENGDFLVKESATTNIVIGAFFFLLFIICMINASNDTIEFDKQRTKYLFSIISLTLFPAIFAFVRGSLHKTAIRINKSGIYVYGQFKTDWLNFIYATVSEKEVPGSIQDNLVMLLQFYKPGEEGFFETNIPMRNTFDKSPEEIIAAIKYFSNAALMTN